MDDGRVLSNTNTKIWFLLLAAGALFCAGCATETAQQRDQRYTATLAAFTDTARRGVERSSGKAQKDWGPAETATYNSLVLGAIQDWARAEHRITEASAASYHRQTSEPFYPLSSTAPSKPASVTLPTSSLGFRSWHNPDGSSGQYIPYPGGNSGGAIFNSDGSSAQYVPYPGGNGGTIYRSDGGMTTVDPEIGR